MLQTHSIDYDVSCCFDSCLGGEKKFHPGGARAVLDETVHASVQPAGQNGDPRASRVRTAYETTLLSFHLTVFSNENRQEVKVKLKLTSKS